MDYYERVLPEPFTILGKQLKPLSVGHLLLLERLGITQVRDNDDLFMCVLVCSTEATDLNLFDDKWLDLKLWWWQLRLGKIDWEAVHNLWAEYFELHSRVPEYQSKHGDSNTVSGTPFLQTLKTTLQAKLNYTPLEALRCPMQQALYDFVTYHEIEGNVEVLNKDYRKEMKERADKLHEELVKAYEEGTINDVG